MQKGAEEGTLIDTLGTEKGDIGWVIAGMILTVVTIGILRYRLIRQKNIESQQLLP